MSRAIFRAWMIYLSPFLCGLGWAIVPVRVVASEPPNLSQSLAQATSQTELQSEASLPSSTSATISLTELARPSLWWAKEQFAARQKFGTQLISAWAAYEGQSNQLGRVDFFVNRQLWSQLDYLVRYTFLHEFGTVANSYGYNVRVFNERQEFLAAYTCNLRSATAPQAVPVCTTTLDSSGKAGFRSRSPNLLIP